MMYVASTYLDFSWIFIVWLDQYMKFNFDMQVHVALSSSYFMVLI
jgi:hypothetical protein